jgi:hypothetical protein
MPDPSELFTNVYVNDCGLEVSTDVKGLSSFKNQD